MPTPAKDATERFSKTVDNYVRYRPSYPDAVIELLQNTAVLKPDSLVADIGAGTGIFSEVLLRHGYSVVAIEPNTPMREAADTLLKKYSQFQSINAPAEATTLADHSVDLITAATAFHWFDQAKAKVEFKRILKPNGFCALFWNLRIKDTALMQAYEQLMIDHGIDYQRMAAERVDDQAITAFYHPHSVEISVFEHFQSFDEPGFIGRILSTSYAPQLGHPGYQSMINKAKQVFQEHQMAGKVSFHYQCKCYVGKL